MVLNQNLWVGFSGCFEPWEPSLSILKHNPVLASAFWFIWSVSDAGNDIASWLGGIAGDPGRCCCSDPLRALGHSRTRTGTIPEHPKPGDVFLEVVAAV